jgi:diguanylate cyclase (GGDEF)-like protein
MLKLNVLLSAFLFASSFLTIFFMAYSFRQKTSYAKTFAFACLAAALYSFGYGLELFSNDLNSMIFWNAVQYLGLPFIPALWLVLALQYTARDALLKPLAFRLGIFLIPILTLLIHYTNQYHHLYYLHQAYSARLPFPVLYLEKGPWYIVQFLFMAVCLLGANILYYSQYQKTTGLFRRQCLIMLLASLLPWLAALLDLLNLSPLHIDWGPFSITVSCVLFLLAFFKYRLFNLKPLAKDKIFQCTEDGLIILDAGNCIIDFNPSAAVILPVLGTNRLGDKAQDVFQGYPPVMESIFEVKKTELTIAADQRQRHYSISTAPVVAERNEIIGWIVNINDITRYAEIMGQLNLLATKDDLTGISNRRYFLERSVTELERLKRSGGPLSLIIFDLDFFKDINDTFGHQAGDCVLQAVANISRQNIRSFDLLGRFGGEEFIIFLPDTVLSDAVKIADRLRQKIESLSVNYENRLITATVSLGVSGVNAVAGEDLNHFIKEADLALYQAKQDGRNCVRAISPHLPKSVSMIRIRSSRDGLV